MTKYPITYGFLLALALLVFMLFGAAILDGADHTSAAASPAAVAPDLQGFYCEDFSAPVKETVREMGFSAAVRIFMRCTDTARGNTCYIYQNNAISCIGDQ